MLNFRFCLVRKLWQNGKRSNFHLLGFADFGVLVEMYMNVANVLDYKENLFYDLLKNFKKKKKKKGLNYVALLQFIP